MGAFFECIRSVWTHKNGCSSQPQHSKHIKTTETDFVSNVNTQTNIFISVFGKNGVVLVGDIRVKFESNTVWIGHKV